MAPQRRHVCYSGWVQGVGFRARACSLARGFEISGHVRNLADGRVELVAEGEPAEIDRYLAAIDVELGRYIRDSYAQVEPAGDPSPQGFEIRY